MARMPVSITARLRLIPPARSIRSNKKSGSHLQWNCFPAFKLTRERSKSKITTGWSDALARPPAKLNQAWRQQPDRGEPVADARASEAEAYAGMDVTFSP